MKVGDDRSFHRFLTFVRSIYLRYTHRLLHTTAHTAATTTAKAQIRCCQICRDQISASVDFDFDLSSWAEQKHEHEQLWRGLL